MPYCPKCKFEYELGIAKCPECDIPLMTQLPEEKDLPEPQADLVSVFQAANEPEAILYCNLLKQSGINATYRSLTIPWYNGITESTPFWGEVLVLDEDEERAAQVIVEYLKTIETQENEETPEEDS